jgi:hypothetical protein
MDALVMGTTSMSKAILDATVNAGGKSATMFEALGLEMEDLNKMDQADKFRTIAKSLDSISDPAKRAAVAAQVFGRSGKDVLAMSGDMANLEQQFKDTGKELSEGELASAAHLKDVFDDFGGSIMRIINNLMRLAGPVLKLLGAGLNFVAKILGRIMDFSEKVARGLAKALGVPKWVTNWFMGSGEMPTSQTAGAAIDRTATTKATKKFADQQKVVATLKADELKIEKRIKMQEAIISNLEATKTALAPLAPALAKGSQAQLSFVRKLGRDRIQSEINQRHKNAVEFAKQTLSVEKEQLKEAKKRTKEAEKQSSLLEKALKGTQARESQITSIMN